MLKTQPNTACWRGAWWAGVFFFILLVSTTFILPQDGSAGNFSDFTTAGFKIGWFLEVPGQGLRAGDTITAIDHHPPQNWLQPGILGGNNAAADELIYTIQRGEQTSQSVVRLTRLAPRGTTQVVWVGIVAGLLLLLIGGFLLQQTSAHPASHILTISATTASLYLLASLLGFNAAMLRVPLYFWLRLAIHQLSYGWLFASMLHLSLEFFPQPIVIYRRFRYPILVLIYALNPLVMAACVIFIPAWTQKVIWLDTAMLYAASLQLILAILIMISRILVDRTPMAYVIRKWLLFGSLFSILLAILSLHQPPTEPFPWLIGHHLTGTSPSLISTETGWLFLVLLPFYITATIPYHHLLRIDRLLLKALIWITGLCVFGLLYLGLVFLLGFLAKALGAAGLDGIWVHVIAMFGLFVLFAYGFPRLQTLIEKFLCPTRLHYQSALPDIKLQLQANLKIEQLHRLMCQEIPAQLEIQSASLLIFEPEQKAFFFSNNLYDPVIGSDHPLVQYLETNHKSILRFFEVSALPADISQFLDQYHIELSIPLIRNRKLAGIYCLGSKLNGVPYTLEENALLSSLGKPAAIAIENTRSYFQLISQLDQTADELRRRTLDLERAIKEAEEDRKEVQQAHQVKQIFLNSVSRELRMPMNTITGLTNLLLNTNLDGQQRELVETIRRNSSDLLEIINNILEYAIIESGKLALEPQPFLLSELIESVLNLAGLEASRKGIDLSYQIEAHTPVVIETDLVRLTQILYNLLEIIIRYTDNGEIRLAVSAKPYHDGESYRFLRTDEPMYELIFSLGYFGSETASVEQFYRIFEMRQADLEQPSLPQAGIGLGLDISRRLCELMGGRSWVEIDDAAHRSSTFYFTILVNAARDTYPAYLDVNQPQLQGKRLLILETESINRRVILLQVRSWGMEAVITDTQDEALRKLNTEPPFDIIMMGLKADIKTVLKITEDLKSIQSAQNLPVILVTEPHPGIPEAVLNRFDAVLRQPVKADQLYNVFIQLFTSQVKTRVYHPPNHFSQLLPEDQPTGYAGLRILLVEDNPTTQKITNLILENLGYRVDRASTGEEAWRSLQRQPYDVILLDVHLTEMGGVEVASRIRRQIPPEQQPYIIGLILHDTPEEREKCRKAGMDECLAKPLKIGDLVCALSQAKTHPAERKHEAAEVSPSIESVQAVLPVLDMEVIERLRKSAGDRGNRLLQEVGTSYLSDVRALIEEMRLSLKNNLPDDLRRAAHTLRVNSAAIGAISITDLAHNLETIERIDSAFQVEQIDRLELELQRLESAFRSLLGSLD